MKNAPSPRQYRPELQGLRAVAALLVAVYHIWIGRVSGGVDVFFVVSGFLITGLLLRQVENYGQVQFFTFAGSLAKRLLPAAMTVILATIIASVLWLPTTLWIDTIKSAAASAAYVQNWYLALNAVDYLGAAKSASPFQHFWALSAQGQFYLLWAVLIAGVAMLTRVTRITLRQTLLGALAAVFASSLAYSILTTATNQSFAYFDTFTRVWEFTLGGLLAMLLPLIRLGRITRVLLGWVGLLAILSCGLVLQVSSVFPGYAALWPTLGAAFVIVAGTTGSRFGVDRLMASKPITALGDISYSLYLWHWPVLLFFLALRDTAAPTLLEGLGLLGISVALAWLTTRMVENPIRFSAAITAQPVRVIALAFACVAPVVLALGMWSHYTLAERERAGLVVDWNDPNYPGALALRDDFEYLGDDKVPVHPGPFSIKGDLPVSYEDGCHQSRADPELRACVYGNPDGRYSIALIGDSHAAQWLPALMHLAELHDWSIVSMTKAACWFNLDVRDPHADHSDACVAWNRQAMKWLEQQRPNIVITIGTVTDKHSGETVPPGFVERWKKLDEHGIRVLAIRDNPRHEFDPAICVDVHGPEAIRCQTPRSEILGGHNPLEQLPDLPGNVFPIDLSDYFCDARNCFPVAGNVLIYRDQHHISRAYAISLALPLIEEIVRIDPDLVKTQAAGWSVPGARIN
jgi:peptidoglycan/LPS O-acetylase OafA/YrhL